MRRVIIATHNQGKVKEIKELFSDLPFDIKSLKDIGCTLEVVEDEPDFAGNSLKKAAEISIALDEIVLADDSGLEVEVLGGKPGVYSARYAGENATDAQNNEKLLAALAGVPQERRAAAFRCVITLYFPGGYTLQAQGSCPGRIAIAPKGAGGFGYDPLFILDAYDRTMAELTSEEKNAISHRGLALKKLKDMLAVLDSENLEPALLQGRGNKKE